MDLVSHFCKSSVTFNLTSVFAMSTIDIARVVKSALEPRIKVNSELVELSTQ